MSESLRPARTEATAYYADSRLRQTLTDPQRVPPRARTRHAFSQTARKADSLKKTPAPLPWPRRYRSITNSRASYRKNLVPQHTQTSRTAQKMQAQFASYDGAWNHCFSNLTGKVKSSSVHRKRNPPSVAPASGIVSGANIRQRQSSPQDRTHD